MRHAHAGSGYGTGPAAGPVPSYSNSHGNSFSSSTSSGYGFGNGGNGGNGGSSSSSNGSYGGRPSYRGGFGSGYEPRGGGRGSRGRGHGHGHGHGPGPGRPFRRGPPGGDPNGDFGDGALSSLSVAERLPPNILRLFAPQPAPVYLAPAPASHALGDRNPTELDGVADLMADLLVHDPNYTPTETAQERRERIARERAEAKKAALAKALAEWNPPSGGHFAKLHSDPYRTLFVGRIKYGTSESVLKREFETYGPVRSVCVITDTKTGNPRGYAFVEFERERDMKLAYQDIDGHRVAGRRIVVDFERGRTIRGWLPQRLGGGLGQTRVGGKTENQNYHGRTRQPLLGVIDGPPGLPPGAPGPGPAMMPPPLRTGMMPYPGQPGFVPGRGPPVYPHPPMIPMPHAAPPRYSSSSGNHSYSSSSRHADRDKTSSYPTSSLIAAPSRPSSNGGYSSGSNSTSVADSKNKNSDRERGERRRERDRERDRDRGRERDRDRERDHEHEYERHRDKDRVRERDRVSLSRRS